MRRQKNKIMHVIDSNGDVVETDEAIAHTFTQYWVNILTSTTISTAADINNLFPDTLASDDLISLMKPPDNEEIEAVVASVYTTKRQETPLVDQWSLAPGLAVH